MLDEILVAELSCRKSGRHVWRNWQGQNEEELPRREEEGGAANWEERNINTILLVQVLSTVALSRTNMPSGPSVSLHQSLVKNYIKKCAVRFC